MSHPDPRAVRYIERTNLALKHLFDKTRTDMPLLSRRGTITTPREALTVFLANDGYLKCMFNRPNHDLYGQAVAMTRTWSEDKQTSFNARYDACRTLFLDASRPWHTGVRYIAYATDKGALDVITLKVEADWNEDADIAPRFILTTCNDHRDNSKRIALSQPAQGRFVKEEVLMDDALNLAKALAHADVDVDLQVRAEMVHVWPWFFPAIPEGAGALKAACEFLRRHFSESTSPADTSGKRMDQA